MRGVFTLDGELGNDWSWDTYYQHGETRVALRVIANTLTNNLTLAADAVRVTATGADAAAAGSGLAVGSIVCRSTLTAPTNGCVPLDVFGEGVASQAAINYVNSAGNIDYENITLNEDVASGSMQGTLPWKLPAGGIAVAFGGEYRKEGGRTVADPRANQALWASGNFANFAGQYNVIEGFGEVDAPILKNNIVQSLDFNGAVRATSYSTSGLVETWKLGLTSQVNDDVRLRATWSTDIRAPNLSELFATAQVNTGSAIDLHSPTCTAAIGANGLPTSTAGCASAFVYNSKGGNLNLVPETARTITGGVVLSPHWVEGLQLSFDWYSINITKSISTLAGDPVQCAAQVATYCSLLSYTGPAYANGKASLVTVYSLPVNAASESTSGLDMQADYLMEIFAGRLDWHFVGNYNDEHTLTNAGVTCDLAGQAGTTLPTGCSGSPKFNGIVSSTYDQGPYSFTVQGRVASSWRYNSSWVSGVNIDNNDLPWKAFLDLRASYKWNDNLQFYAAADDVLNNPPLVVAPIYTGSSYQSIGSQSDNLGRVVRVGVRYSN
jgi:iron complex outermembrane receptor protein